MAQPQASIRSVMCCDDACYTRMGVNWTGNFNPFTPGAASTVMCMLRCYQHDLCYGKLGINAATAAAGLVPASAQAGQAARDQRSGHCKHR
jgi:hypothetical protein